MMRWAGKLAHCLGCADAQKPIPPTLRPPPGGDEESEQEDQFFRNTKTVTG